MRRCGLARLRRLDTESSVTPPAPAMSGPTATGIGVADAGSGWMAAGCARRIAAPSGFPVPGAKTTASGASIAVTVDGLVRRCGSSLTNREPAPDPEGPPVAALIGAAVYQSEPRPSGSGLLPLQYLQIPGDGLDPPIEVRQVGP